MGMPAAVGSSDVSRKGTSPSKLAEVRSSSVTSTSRQHRSHQNDGYTAEHELDDGEEGDYEGDDGDDDEDEMHTSGDVYGGQDMLNETTVKSGYLWKRGEKRKNWKKRWFALRSSKLCYYKNEKEYQLLRFIDMADVHTVAAIALKKNDNSFGIVTSKRQYYVRASNAKEMHSWIDALKDVQHQIQQSNTMTQDTAAMEMATSSGGENHVNRMKPTSASPSVGSLDRQHSVKGINNVSPINIVIPGKGLYTSPAQVRQNSTGGSIMSPLTATSESDAGTATGAEQFGMSYASSAGYGHGSSPNRHGGTGYHLYHDHGSAGGRASPHSNSGGDELSDSAKKGKLMKKSSVGINENSGGEGSSGMRTGWTAVKGNQNQNQLAGSQQEQIQSSGPVLSSSDEDGEGDDWDEDEIADQAMPLPGSSTVTSTLAAKSAQSGTQSDTFDKNEKSNVESNLFNDPNKVILQGYLMKQSSRRKQWRKRYFTLTSSYLAYSRHHMNGKAHRQIPLTSILDAIEYTSKKPQSNLQSPPPSSPAPLNVHSPPINPPAIIFQLGAGNQDAPTGSNNFSKEVPTTRLAETHAEQTSLDRRTSILTPSTPKKKKENCFKIITPKRTYVVGAPTEDEEMKWLCALQALLAHWREMKDVESVDGANTNTHSTNYNINTNTAPSTMITTANHQQTSNPSAAAQSTPTKVQRRSSAMDSVGVQG